MSTKENTAAKPKAPAVNTETVEVTVDGKKVQVPTDANMRSQGMDTISARIRHLSSLGVSTGDISRIVVRSNGQHPIYQHVRNVLKTPLKKDTPAAAAK